MNKILKLIKRKIHFKRRLKYGKYGILRELARNS